MRGKFLVTQQPLRIGSSKLSFRAKGPLFIGGKVHASPVHGNHIAIPGLSSVLLGPLPTSTVSPVNGFLCLPMETILPHLTPHCLSDTGRKEFLIDQLIIMRTEVLMIGMLSLRSCRNILTFQTSTLITNICGVPIRHLNMDQEKILG